MLQGPPKITRSTVPYCIHIYICMYIYVYIYIHVYKDIEYHELRIYLKLILVSSTLFYEQGCSVSTRWATVQVLSFLHSPIKRAGFSRLAWAHGSSCTGRFASFPVWQLMPKDEIASEQRCRFAAVHRKVHSSRNQPEEFCWLALLASLHPLASVTFGVKVTCCYPCMKVVVLAIDSTNHQTRIAAGSK